VRIEGAQTAPIALIFPIVTTSAISWNSMLTFRNRLQFKPPADFELRTTVPDVRINLFNRVRIVANAQRADCSKKGSVGIVVAKPNGDLTDIVRVLGDAEPLFNVPVESHPN
jgi:hypothetical protein